MMIKFLFIIYLLSVSLYAETVYKTVDEEGNVFFTDTPIVGAEKIEVKKAQTIEAAKPINLNNTRNNQSSSELIQYKKLKIINPKNDATIVGTQGSFSIDIELEPALAEQDMLVLLMDGNELQTAKTTRFALSNVDRCTHTFQVAIRNEKNRYAKQSNQVTVHVRRTSNLAPELTPNPNIETPLNPPRPVQTGISPTNPPRPNTSATAPAAAVTPTP